MKGGFFFISLRARLRRARQSLGFFVIVRLPLREAVAISLRKGIASQSCIMIKYEIATPERFSVQARNDRKVQPLQ